MSVLLYSTRRGGVTLPVVSVLLYSTRRGGETLPVASVWRNEEGRPSSCLFDFIRHDEEGRPSLSCPFDVLWCNKAPNTRSVPILVYSWCSCPLYLTRHVKCAQMGTFYVSGVVSNTEHQKHTCFSVFLCSAPSPSQGCLLSYHPSLAGSILIN